MGIPAIIHQIWIQGWDQAPAHIRDRRMRSCHCLAADAAMEYRFWDGPQIEQLLTQEAPELWRVYQSQSHHAGRADVARYVILRAFGGFYVDADYQCQKPLAVLHGTSHPMRCSAPPMHANLVYIPTGNHFVMNAFIGSCQGHPLWGIVFRNLLERAQMASKKPFWMWDTPWSTGTGLLHDSVHAYHKSHPQTQGRAA